MSRSRRVDERWVRFFEAAGHPEVLQEERFIDKPTRRKNMSQMYEVAEAILPEKTTDEWLKILKEAHVPAIHANEIGEVLEDPDPHLKSVGLLREREHPSEGGYIEVRPPVRFSGFGYIEVRPPVRFSAFDYPDARHAPALGEHTAEVDRELGLDPGNGP
jgi:crotonobetainyl-CoA:carnitine CoA-transferase CaiB-like acyl-CoA transferase